MQMNRSETRSISIAAPPQAVLEFVGDARTLPSWAPGFARAIEADGSQWVIDTGAGQARIDVRVAREQGTVDIVSAADPRRGAFTRVVPNGAGSEYLFTLFFPDAASEDGVAAQMAVVEAELRAVRERCEST
jgi:polyketide cyclase/dehydrase/lipid transport protein